MRGWIACLGFLSLLTVSAQADPSHGLSAFGDLKYSKDFTHFDYVNPNAPKGGRIVTLGRYGETTFNNLNRFILKGVAPEEMKLLFDRLMTRAHDEPDAVYAQAAEWADLADDGKSITFKLRDYVTFSDGSKMTAQDVAFSFEVLKTQGHPRHRVDLADVEKAEALDELTVKYTFKGNNTRDLPMIVARLPIFSKAYYSKTKFDKTTLKPPLGSGPYKVKNLKQDQFIVFELRDDYWGKDLPVNKGRFNFGEIKLRYYRDRALELEALKAGELDFREEFVSRSWMTEYEIPAVKDGRLIKKRYDDSTISGAQGFFFNLRRDKFKDIRMREALGYAFDYEWTNKNMFFNLYTRTASFFENSDLKARGKPTEGEMELLQPLRGELPEATFGEAMQAPVTNGSGQDRKLLRRAHGLLEEAGWKLKDQKRVNAQGEQLTLEFLTLSASFERIIAPYLRNLELLGIKASIRRPEAAQYQERLKTFDFDVIGQRLHMRGTPGIELRSYFSTDSANLQGSFNLAGLESAAIDQLVENALTSRTREDLVNSTRALDRAVRAYHIWVPHWFKNWHFLTYWDIFGAPENKPGFDRSVLETWWIDQKKFSELDRTP